MCNRILEIARIATSNDNATSKDFTFKTIETIENFGRSNF